MDQWTSTFAPLLGRILLGGFFLWSGIQKTLNFPSYVDFWSHSGYPYPLYIALCAVTLEVVASITLIVDLKTRISALLLAIYMLFISFLFVHVATVTDVQLFLQNMAIVGGLLMTAGYGTSRWTPLW